MLADFANDVPWIQGRPIESIFIGGGTPSLFEAKAYQRLFTGLQQHAQFSPDIEITIEANPGTIEHGHFQSYRDVGINRVSLGVQSFNPSHLQKLGRIHSGDEAKRAIEQIQSAGFNAFNIDLMHGLPNQTEAEALSDIDMALSFGGPHLSWYQLTIEPNTVFYSKPPQLPDDDALFEIEELGMPKIEQAALKRYEISAYAKPGFECLHNLNYWQFGDYLGIGAGAHAKVTDLKKQEVNRIHKKRQPKAYLDDKKNFVAGQRILSAPELPFEFLLNGLRLIDGVPSKWLQERAFSDVKLQHQLLDNSNNKFKATPEGLRFLNTLLADFLP